MPTYLYRCNQCDHEFEARQRMSDAPLTECPVCGGDIRRVVGSVGIVFKGKGFYVTDHRGSNGGGRVQTSDTSASSGDSPADKSTKEKSGDGSKPADSKATPASSSTSSGSTTSAAGNS